jgi:hypothetical protein
MQHTAIIKNSNSVSGLSMKCWYNAFLVLASNSLCSLFISTALEPRKYVKTEYYLWQPQVEIILYV